MQNKEKFVPNSEKMDKGIFPYKRNLFLALILSWSFYVGFKYLLPDRFVGQKWTGNLIDGSGLVFFVLTTLLSLQLAKRSRYLSIFKSILFIAFSLGGCSAAMHYGDKSGFFLTTDCAAGHLQGVEVCRGWTLAPHSILPMPDRPGAVVTVGTVKKSSVAC